jgi:uncharacterized membrane protein
MKRPKVCIRETLVQLEIRWETFVNTVINPQVQLKQGASSVSEQLSVSGGLALLGSESVTRIAYSAWRLLLLLLQAASAASVPSDIDSEIT